MRSSAALLLDSPPLRLRLGGRCILASVCCASLAVAQTPPQEEPTERTVPVSPVVSRSRVVLVKPSADNAQLAEAPTRIRAELEAAGFEVEIVDGDPSLGPREQLERIEAQSSGGPAPVATIVLAAAGSGVAADIWIADRVTAKTTVRRIDISHASQSASILAVRTVELLRASLLETRVAQDAAKPRPEPTVSQAPAPSTSAPQSPPSEPTPTRATLDLGALVLFGFDQIGPLAGPTLRASFGSSVIAGRLSLAAPILGDTVSAPLGTARVQPFFATLETVIATESDTLRWYGSAGLGAYFTRVQGSAVPPAIAHDQRQFGAFVDLGLGAQFAIAENVGLFLEPHALWLLPAVAVDIAGREAGRIGHPALSAVVGASFRL